MGFINDYPYNDFHELNLDWILTKIKELQSTIDTFEDSLTAKANAYTDEKYATLISDFATFKSEVNATLSTFENDNATFKTAINTQIATMESEIEAIGNRVNSAVSEANDYTQQAIANNNEYIINETTEGLKTATVTNYFTGEKVSVQEMFNYLASLHLDNAITYDELTAVGITYDQLTALNITYTQLTMNGKLLIHT